MVRYGYKDIHKDDHKFEDKLIQNLGEFILTEDDVEMEHLNGEDGEDGPMQFSGIRSSSLVHAVNNDNALILERSTNKGKEPDLGITQVPHLL